MLRIIIIIIVLAIISFFMIPSKPRVWTTLTISNIKLTVEIADDLGEQTQGLSGRESLCETCGMLFIYDQPQIQSFWMRGMQFPLDIIFIRGGQIVELAEHVPVPIPGLEIPKIQSREEADMVLEVNAGFVLERHIRVGDRIGLE